VGVLSSQQIRSLLQTPEPLISNYVDLGEQIQSNGFDCTLHSIAAFSGAGRIGDSNSSRTLPNTKDLTFRDDGFVHLEPGVYIARLNETVALPLSVMALAKPRSSLLRCGVAVHNAVWDAGYNGQSQVQVVVYNPHGFDLARNARIVQMVFMTLDKATDAPYEGSYQGERAQQSHSSGGTLRP
jgi:dUTP pyrophosphatase